jgi:glyoxylase-like metal-dependent hydrolase (beta-lactamase superfamily II)/rhodanese-related sulfurtransferase
MHWRRFFVDGLAHASYLVGDTRRGVAAVIDPQRDIEPYLDEAHEKGLNVSHVFLTHLHADFVAGHMELKDRCGATIWISAQAQAKFAHKGLADGQVVQVGDLLLRAIATPGHSPESMCFLAADGDGGEQRLFTGDTLFVGDVGRPDLFGEAVATKLAEQLHESLWTKLFTLDQETIVAPAHGAGSLCGKNLGKEPFSTIARERDRSAAEAAGDRTAFVQRLLAGMPEAPPQFARNVASNRAGPALLRRLPHPSAMQPDEVERELALGALVVDVRSVEQFKAGHVPGSLFLGGEPSSHTWAQWLVPPATPLILAAETDPDFAAARRLLARVGVDSVRGRLDGGVDAWARSGRKTMRLEDLLPQRLHELRTSGDGPALLDVRQPGEWAAGHAPGAGNVPLGLLPRRAPELADGPALAVMCQGGYRSVIGCSVLLRAGKRDVVNVPGGFKGWASAGLPVEEPATTR